MAPSLDDLQTILAQFPYTPWQVGGAALGALTLYEVYQVVYALVIRPYTSPLRNVPGPANDSLLGGNLRTIYSGRVGTVHEKWIEQWGHVIAYTTSFRSRRVITTDLRALGYVLNNADIFVKSPGLRNATKRVFGAGLLHAQHEDHRRQRKLMNPAFGPRELKELIPFFYEKGQLLKDIWIHELEDAGGKKDMDVLLGLSRATLDVVGAAGFDYDFDTLRQGETNELCRAFMGLFGAPSNPLWDFFQVKFPILRLIPTKRVKDQDESKRVMNRIGGQLVAAKVAAIQGAAEKLDKNAFQKRDILTSIVRANLATDLKPSEKLSNEEMIDQICTMLIAGHETTSTSLSWMFLDLAKPQYKHIQDKLREELLSISSEEPSIEELNALPYLDAVIRETLRKNAVVESVVRWVEKDTVVPLAKPFVDKNGAERYGITVGAGEEIQVPLLIVNRSKEVWGDDAEEFNPDRWLKDGGHPNSSDVPGVWSDLMTFIGGPRACIGWRMALHEMKVMTFVLMRHVEFQLRDPMPDVKEVSYIVIRPMVKQPDGQMKTSMPLRLKLVNHD